MPGAIIGRWRRRRIVTTGFLALAAISTYPIAFDTLNQLLHGESSDREQTLSGQEIAGVRARGSGTAAEAEFLRSALKQASPSLDEAAVNNAFDFVSAIEKK